MGRAEPPAPRFRFKRPIQLISGMLAATPTAIAVATSTTAATAPTPFRTRTGFVHRESTPFEVLACRPRDRRLRAFGRRHGDESEAA